MPVITLTTRIRAPIERCFNLSRSIDLHLQSAAHTHETVVAGVQSGLIGAGEMVTWRARHFGFYHRLTVKITVYEYPFFFRDEMVSGPFSMLNHQHCFSHSNGVTTMKDVFEFEIPCDLPGRWLAHTILKKHLYRFLVHRNEQIKKAAESSEWHTFVPA